MSNEDIAIAAGASYFVLIHAFTEALEIELTFDKLDKIRAKVASIANADSTTFDTTEEQKAKTGKDVTPWSRREVGRLERQCAKGILDAIPKRPA